MTMVSPPPASLAARSTPSMWPDVAAVPRAPVRAAVAQRIFRHAVRSAAAARHRGRRPPLRRRHRATDPVMRLVRPQAFFHRLGATGTIGFGEAYMAGDWTADDLAGVLVGVRRATCASWSRRRCTGCATRCCSRQPAHHDNTIEGARDEHPPALRPVQRAVHDVPRRVDDLLLGAVRRRARTTPARTSPDAQRRKIDRLLDAAGVRAGTRLLEIGTGWGELAHPGGAPRGAGHQR